MLNKLFIFIVLDYIKNKIKLTNDELRIILVYIICEYIPKNDDDFPKDLLQLVEDVVLNKYPEAAEKLIEYAEANKDDGKKEVKTLL